MKPQVLNVLRGEASEIRRSRFGEVGTIFSGEGIEAVWVSKEAEEIDPDWFSQDTIDLLLVVQGMLRVEFADADTADRVLEPGDLLILPAGVKCRACRWPRDAAGRTLFLAVYPVPVR